MVHEGEEGNMKSLHLVSKIPILYMFIKLYPHPFNLFAYLFYTVIVHVCHLQCIHAHSYLGGSAHSFY